MPLDLATICKSWKYNPSKQAYALEDITPQESSMNSGTPQLPLICIRIFVMRKG